MTETEIKNLFGYNLKRLRKEKGISQMQFAEAVEMGFTFISDIENGKKWVSAETISKFTTVLGVEPYRLFLPQGFEFKSNADVVSFANDLSEAFKTIQAQYFV